MNPHDENDDELDQLAALRAGLDQSIAIAPEVARVTRGFFDAFVGQGFLPAQALYLAACQMFQNPGSAP